MPSHYDLMRKITFRLRAMTNGLIFATLRRWYWSAQGMVIGRHTAVPRMMVTWPHQVQIGSNCVLEPDIFFKFDGICKPGPNIFIGDHTFLGRGCEFNISGQIHIGGHCLIASGVKFIDHDHGLALDALMRVQPPTQSPIALGDNVWIGANAIILQGTSIGAGAIVAAGAVVRSNVAPYDIVGGVPARVLKNRRHGIEIDDD
jgi:Hexapeptide repeat of succinyl-transferase